MVKQRSSCFEAAARWYFSDLREPKRARPTALHKRFLQIRDAADRLLAHLGIDSPEDAADGPGDPYIFDELIMATDDGTEDDVAEATEKVARLSVLLSEALSAAGELRIRAQQAADDVVDIGKLTVPKGFPGDRALNSWTWRMLVVHKLLTGQNALSPLQLGQGIRLYRFLAAAGRPLGIEQSQSQWKERVKTIITSHTEYTNDSP